MHRSTFLFSLCVSHNNNGHQCQLLANRFAYSRFQAYLHASTSRFLSRKKATISFLVTRLDRIIMGLLALHQKPITGYLPAYYYFPWGEEPGLTPHPATLLRSSRILFDFLLKWIFISKPSHEFSRFPCLCIVVNKKSILTGCFKTSYDLLRWFQIISCRRLLTSNLLQTILRNMQL